MEAPCLLACRGYEVPVREAIALIHQAGGSAVIAHPWTIEPLALQAILGDVAQHPGLVGLEVVQGGMIQEGT